MWRSKSSSCRHCRQPNYRCSHWSALRASYSNFDFVSSSFSFLNSLPARIIVVSSHDLSYAKLLYYVQQSTESCAVAGYMECLSRLDERFSLPTVATSPFSLINNGTKVMLPELAYFMVTSSGHLLFTDCYVVPQEPPRSLEHRMHCCRRRLVDRGCT